jgi:signal transduction histidine kinase/CheY-like chemotaxis protein
LKSFKPFFQTSGTLAMSIAGLGIVYMVCIIPSPASYLYYAGLILVMIWQYTFARVRFVRATIAGWVIVAAYEIAAVWVADTPTKILISNNFFLVGANIAGMLASYSIELYARRDFFLTYTLEAERQTVKEQATKLENMNSELEQKIKESETAEAKRAYMEKMFVQAQKMEALGTLAGGVAHDFNNLLTVINGSAALLLKEMGDKPSAHGNVSNIEHCVEKGAKLTAQLLAFARGGKYEVKTADLNKIIIKNIEMFGRTKKAIAIHNNLATELWAVDIDQGQIEQMLLNLLVNAGQAMPNGGDIYITTENTLLDLETAYQLAVEPGNYVKVEVRDTGIGMDDVTKRRVFEPFFTTKEIGKGSGLGLASAYGILRNHGGAIIVASEQGKGSVFSFFLPASSKAIVREKEHSEAPSNGSETILVVDDEEMVLNVASQMLRQLGYEVMTASSGEEALDIYLAHRSKIHLVVLDIIMPGMDGGETYDRLKRFEPGIKVLLSSGYSIDDAAMEIMQRGCNGFLQKPFNFERLSKKVREVLDSK